MNRIKNGLFWFACGLVVITAVRIFAPAIETQLFPVYSKFQIVTLEAVNETQTRAVFRFTKLRECEPRGGSWSDDELGQQFTITLQGEPNLTPRPLGEQLTRPRIFEGTPAEISNRLVATIFSRCPFIPWETRSNVYP